LRVLRQRHHDPTRSEIAVALRIQPQIKLIQALQAIAEELYEQSDPFRVTIRVNATNDGDLPVLAEVNREDALSLAGGMSAGPGGQRYKAYDIFQAATVIQISADRRLIVQNDTSIDPPPLPDSVDYGSVRAQLLTALEHDGEFIGLISVHQDQPRHWSDADIRAIEAATAEAQHVIAEATWFDI
jgi:GAF domain-containing protein